MAQFVRVGAPRDLQVGENVAIINRQDCLRCLVDVLRTLGVERRVALPIRANEGSG